MKLICTPLTEEAMSLLDNDRCPSALLECLRLTDSEHLKLEKPGIFDVINNALGKMIDNYEDEHITIQKDLVRTLKVLRNSSLPVAPDLLKKLIHINEVAIVRKTGIFFYF